VYTRLTNNGVNMRQQLNQVWCSRCERVAQSVCDAQAREGCPSSGSQPLATGGPSSHRLFIA